LLRFNIGIDNDAIPSVLVMLRIVEIHFLVYDIYNSRRNDNESAIIQAHTIGIEML